MQTPNLPVCSPSLLSLAPLHTNSETKDVCGHTLWKVEGRGSLPDTMLRTPRLNDSVFPKQRWQRERNTNRTQTEEPFPLLSHYFRYFVFFRETSHSQLQSSFLPNIIPRRHSSSGSLTYVLRFAVFLKPVSVRFNRPACGQGAGICNHEF